MQPKILRAFSKKISFPIKSEKFRKLSKANLCGLAVNGKQTKQLEINNKHEMKSLMEIYLVLEKF